MKPNKIMSRPSSISAIMRKRRISLAQLRPVMKKLGRIPESKLSSSQRKALERVGGHLARIRVQKHALAHNIPAAQSKKTTQAELKVSKEKHETHLRQHREPLLHRIPEEELIRQYHELHHKAIHETASPQEIERFRAIIDHFEDQHRREFDAARAEENRIIKEAKKRREEKLMRQKTNALMK